MVEVTSQNFKSLLPKFEEQIKSASFVCLDFEFSGLHTNRCSGISLFDTTQERYSILRNSCQDYTVIQCGLSLFKYDKISRTYSCNTYTFWIFPQMNEFIKRQTNFESAACNFLTRYDFDFNKSIYGGITYLNEDEIKICELGVKSRYKDADDIILNDIKAAFRNRKLNLLKRWDTEARDIDFIEIDCMSRGMSAILKSDVIKMFDGLIPEIKPDEHSTLVIHKGTPQSKAEFLHKESMKDEEELQEAIGFTHIVRMMKKYKKPLLGHNLLMDIFYIYEKFCHPLPESIDDFKKSLRTDFPIIYDTRHIINNMRFELRTDEKFSELFKGVSLLSLYGECQAGRVKELLYQPCIVDNLGAGCGMKAHNAGYDSALVGHVFIRLAHFYTLWKFNSPNIKPFHLQDYLREFTKFKNCLNLIRCSLSHINLSKADPASKRPQWLLVTKRDKSELQTDHISHVLSAFGNVDVRKISRCQCIVAMPSIGMAAGLLVEMADHPMYRVVRYRPQRALITNLLTVSLVGSLSLIAGYFAIKLMKK